MSTSAPSASNRLLQTRSWLRGVLFVAATLVLWLAQISLPVPPDAGLDRSWQLSLADAYVQARQFGPEVVFTYGPWGFLALDGFMPDALTAKLVWELLGRLAFSATVVSMSAALPWLRRWLFVAAVIATSVFFETASLVIIALLALTWLAPANARTWQRVLAILWLGFFAHFKFVLCLEAVALIGITSAMHLLERRPRLAIGQALGFAGAYVIGWIAAGQSLGNLWRYWHLSWDTSSGYSWAMAIDPTMPVLVAGLVLLAWSGTFVWLIGRSEESRAQKLGGALIVIAVWLLAWKQGFTRADLHTFGFFVATLLFGLALPGLFRPRRQFCWQDINVGLCIWGATTVGPGLLSFGPNITRHRWLHNPAAIADLGAWRSDFLKGIDKAKADAKNPALQAAVGEGTVDLLNFEQGMIFLNGLNYQPRPIIQSYSAYTAALVIANWRFFRSERAPEFVIARLNTIDGRYPGQDDALALAEFARSYRKVEGGADFALLQRKISGAAMNDFARVPLGEPVPHYGQELAVPDGGGHPVWIEIDFRPTLLGRLRAFFYHAMPPTMTVTLDNGEQHGFRIIPTTSRQGFFLRPLLLTHNDLAQLVEGRASRWPQTIRFAIDEARASWFWRRPRVKFFALTDLTLKRAELLQALVDAHAVNVRPLSVRSDTAVDWVHANGHALLFAHAPSEVILPVSENVRRLTGGCGIMEGAYTTGATDGADFSIEARLPDGGWRLLWERRLAPTAVAADRGFQPFNVEIPQGATELRLRIGSGGQDNASWDWTYWGDLKVRP